MSCTGTPGRRYLGGVIIDTSVFILAAGSARRFNGAIKQLLPVYGEPIIRRTVRLVREHKPDAAIWIVTWRPELMFDDVPVIPLHNQPRQLSDTIGITELAWGTRNIILLGDVVFSEAAIKTILDYSGPLAVFARDRCPIKEHSELFSLSFPDKDNTRARELLDKSGRIFENTDMENWGGLYKICLASLPKWKRIFFNCSPIHPAIRPFRDYFIWHIMGGRKWHPYTFPMIPIDDDMTTDIDTPEDYARFLELFG